VTTPPPNNPPKTTTTKPKPPAPIARSDSFSWTPNHDSSGWFIAHLTILDNDTGNDWTDIYFGDGTYGTTKWNDAGQTIDYTPDQNGAYTDSFTYRLKGPGGYSQWATVHVTVYCNTAFTCS
ncbi:MAG TPA: Ig-like domain-containing protein, partial [Acidimicrobiia bacterium]|nr:Ig-like domain-containing protein [Acidimicrobiia bacterium]